MNCYKCKMDAVALQTEVVTEPNLCTTTLDTYIYIPVCEEHKSDSTLDEMVIPLEFYWKDAASESAMDAIETQEKLDQTKREVEGLEESCKNRDKRIAELELGSEIQRLKNMNCNCPRCCAERTGQHKSLHTSLCSTASHIKELETQLEDMDSIELECQCPECIDMRENHGQTRLQLRQTIAELKLDLQNALNSYRSEQSALEEVLCENTERERNSKIILKFIRTYFTTYRFPGLESHPDVCIDGLSDERLMNLIQLGRAAYHSKMAIQEFVDTLD